MIVAVILVILLLAGGGTGAALVLLGGGSVSSGPLQVGHDTGVTVQRQPVSDCNILYVATATGSLSGSGVLVYHFDASDTSSGDVHSTSGDFRSTITTETGFRYQWSIRYSGHRTGAGTITFAVTSPTTLQRSVSFDSSC